MFRIFYRRRIILEAIPSVSQKSTSPLPSPATATVIKIEHGSIIYDTHVEPQWRSNMVWAYAKTAEQNPRFFRTVADTIITGDLATFRPQELSNIAWAFATASVYCPMIFDNIVDAIIARQNEINPQGVDSLLFTSTASAWIGECSCQHIANIAWAFVVTDVAAPDLFDDRFIIAVREKEHEFHIEHLTQIHQ